MIALHDGAHVRRRVPAGRLYLVAVAISDPASLVPLRREMRGLLLPGQRELHFKKEKPARRKALADTIAQLTVRVNIYARSCDRDEELARQVCITALTTDLLELERTVSSSTAAPPTATYTTSEQSKEFSDHTPARPA